MGNFKGAFGKGAVLRTLPLGFNTKTGQEFLVTNLPKYNDFHTVDLHNNSCK